jgi:hypothetical protein
MRGFHVYRGSTKITTAPLPAATREFDDTFDGATTYTVKAVAESNRESTGTRSVKIFAGNADKQPPQIILVSPPASAPENRPIPVKARLLDTRDTRCLSARLHYRHAGETTWTTLAMRRRVKAVFTATIPAQSIGPSPAAAFLEYYVTADDGANSSIFPSESPARPLVLTLTPNANPSVPGPPVLAAQNNRLEWRPVANAHTYRLYRSTGKTFEPSNNTFLTYIGTGDASAAGGPKGEELHFTDLAQNFSGDDLRGTYYYRLTAVTRAGNESTPGNPIPVTYGNADE